MELVEFKETMDKMDFVKEECPFVREETYILKTQDKQILINYYNSWVYFDEYRLNFLKGNTLITFMKKGINVFNILLDDLSALFCGEQEIQLWSTNFKSETGSELDG